MVVAAEGTAVDGLGREKVRFWLWSKSIGPLVRGSPVDVLPGLDLGSLDLTDDVVKTHLHRTGLAVRKSFRRSPWGRTRGKTAPGTLPKNARRPPPHG